MTALDDLWSDREHQSVVRLAYVRKIDRIKAAIAGLDPKAFATERDYRHELIVLRSDLTDAEALFVRSDAIIDSLGEQIIDAWVDAHTVKPTDVPQPWTGSA
jgi:hypothetical protein